MQTNLYCIPYAGGSAINYSKWRRHLPDGIRLVYLELAGRGRKIRSPLYESMSGLIDDIFPDFLAQYRDHIPYSLYGHSFGSWIAYKLYFKILGEGLNLPSAVFFSGRRPPHVASDSEPQAQNLDEAALIELAKRYGGGIDDAFLKREDIRKMFLTVFGADLKLMASYENEKGIAPLDCDVVSLYGTGDATMDQTQAEQWRLYAPDRFKLIKIEGEHLFPFTNPESTVSEISKIIYKKRGDILEAN
jgi:surfactin synthase thioesterase subunit